MPWHAEVGLAVLKTIFNFALGPPPPGDSGGGSGLSFPFWKPGIFGRLRPGSGGNLFFISISAQSAARWVGLEAPLRAGEE